MVRGGFFWETEWNEATNLNIIMSAESESESSSSSSLSAGFEQGFSGKRGRVTLWLRDGFGMFRTRVELYPPLYLIVPELSNRQMHVLRHFFYMCNRKLQWRKEGKEKNAI
jgi:hypothetical protein